MASWEEIRRGIFAGESGGDPNALYGYANRPGGRFSGTNVSDMSVADVMAFTDPRGEYAQSVKGQIGRVATPVGMYQVVGSTLRDAVKGLGLTGSERFDAATQEQIGKWIYSQQGTGAWEGYKGPQSGGSAMGLLSTGMPEAAPQTFGQKFKAGLKDGSFFDNLAVAFNGMRMNPDQGLNDQVAQRQESRQQDAVANRTVAWLQSMGTPQALQAAEALATGSIDAGSAVQFALAKADDSRTALQQNIEYMMQTQGKTFDEALVAVQGASGGTTNNIGGKAESAFETESAKGQAAMFNRMTEDGIAATQQMGQIDVIDQLLQSGAGGTVDTWKAWAQDTLGVNIGAGGAVEALSATLNQLVPAQRPVGAGTMSDKDVALFKSSLPQLVNSPEGNRIITSTMRGIAEYKRMQGDIAGAVSLGTMTRQEGLAALRQIPDPMADAVALIRTLAPPEDAGGPGMSPADAARLLLKN